jgi:hypothetical protein
MKEFYSLNMAALKEAAPHLHDKLKTIQSNEQFEVFAGKDPIDINILDHAQNTPLYTEPVADTLAFLKEMGPYSRYPFLVFFGVGNGFFYKAMLANEAFMHLIVIEPNLELLYIALNLSDFSKEIKDQRILFFHSEDINSAVAQKLMGFEDIGLFVKLYNIHLVSPYYGLFQDEIMRVNKTLIEAVVQFVSTHGNDATDSLIGIRHFIQNIPLMLSSVDFQSFLKKKNSDLAIIASTGPSLMKQLPLLKEMQQYVTIIVPDASMPVLIKNGITPDIVTSLERIELTAKFFDATPKASQKDIVFVHSALQHKTVLDASYGQKVLPMRPFGYMRAFELDNYGYAGIGMSAANLAFEIAFLMGFKNIAFIGQDLAFGADGTSHAKDHTFGENDEAFLANVKNLDKDNEIMVPAYGGIGEVKTTSVWKMFLNYFITNVSDVSDICTTYNATEGGARIEGTIEMPFVKVIEKLVDTTQIKTAIKLPNTRSKKKLLAKAQAKIEHELSYAKEVKTRIETLFLEVQSHCELLGKKEKITVLDEAELERLGELLDAIDEIKQLFYDDNFKEMYWETVRSFIVHQEMELAKIMTRQTNNQEEHNLRNIEFLFAHQQWLFSLAGGLENQLLVMKEAYQTW